MSSWSTPSKTLAAAASGTCCANAPNKTTRKQEQNLLAASLRCCQPTEHSTQLVAPWPRSADPPASCWLPAAAAAAPTAPLLLLWQQRWQVQLLQMRLLLPLLTLLPAHAPPAALSAHHKAEHSGICMHALGCMRNTLHYNTLQYSAVRTPPAALSAPDNHSKQ